MAVPSEIFCPVIQAWLKGLPPQYLWFLHVLSPPVFAVVAADTNAVIFAVFDVAADVHTVLFCCCFCCCN